MVLQNKAICALQVPINSQYASNRYANKQLGYCKNWFIINSVTIIFLAAQCVMFLRFF